MELITKTLNMKRIGITLIALMMVSAAISQETQEYTSMDNPRLVRIVKMDSVAQLFFGAPLTDQLKGTRKIEAYKLSHYLNGPSDQKVSLENFEVLDTAVLSRAQQSQIADLLTQPESYIEDPNIKNLCLFLPDLGLKFALKDQEVNALVSLDCKMVRFYYDRPEEPVNFLELNIKGNFNGFDDFFEAIFPSTIAQGGKSGSLFASKDETPKEPIYYKVKKGEGWWQIAESASKAYGKKITMQDIWAVNNLSKQTARQQVLKVGQKILVGYAN